MKSVQIVMVLVVVLIGGMAGSVWAQQGATMMVPASVLGDILKEMEQVKRHVKRIDVSDEIKVLEAKLDQILDNQIEIQKELDVIRIRASRKR